MTHTTSERLRDTESRLGSAKSALSAAESTVAKTADAAEAVDRWREDPVKVAATVVGLVAIIAFIWALVARRSGTED